MKRLCGTLFLISAIGSMSTSLNTNVASFLASELPSVRNELAKLNND